MKAPWRPDLRIFGSFLKTPVVILAATLFLSEALSLLYASSQSRSPSSLFASTSGAVEQPSVNSVVVVVQQGSTISAPVAVNNTLSSTNWIVVRAVYFLVSPEDISITSKDLLPYVSAISGGSVATPFSISLGVSRDSLPGSYLAKGSIQIRSSLLPPYVSTVLQFNITIIVVPPPPPSISTQLAVLDILVGVYQLHSHGHPSPSFHQENTLKLDRERNVLVTDVVTFKKSFLSYLLSEYSRG